MLVLTKFFPLSSSFESFSVSCFFIRLLLTKRDATFSSLTSTVSVLAIGKFIRWSFHFSTFQELSQSATMKPFKLIFLSVYFHSQKSCSYTKSGEVFIQWVEQIKLFSKANEIRAFLSFDTRQSNESAQCLNWNVFFFVRFRDIINILLTSFSRAIL